MTCDKCAHNTATEFRFNEIRAWCGLWQMWRKLDSTCGDDTSNERNNDES